MAIWHKSHTTYTELERIFCHWIYFHLCSKNIFMAVLRGRLHPLMDPSLTWISVRASGIQYTRWQHLAVQSTSSRFRFCSVMGRTVHESAFNITKHIKSKCSHSALGTSLTLVVKTETIGYQDPCFPAWSPHDTVSLHTAQFQSWTYK